MKSSIVAVPLKALQALALESFLWSACFTWKLPSSVASVIKLTTS